MEENTSNPSTSPYMFRPILEPSTINDDSLPRSYNSQSSIQASTSYNPTDRLSVIERSCSSRIRVSSGGAVIPLEITNANNFRPQAVSSPTVAPSYSDGIQKRPPKLYNCWRTNPESWSSTGSRHSSRPGSSQASSRPPSQCNNTLQQQQQGGVQHSSSLQSTMMASSNLYSRSNNNSNSDVSLAQKTFQKLSVSSRINAECRRAAFKSQKWSNSFDQTCLAVSSSSPSSVGTTSHIASPGRRRQSSLQQAPQNHQRSLDLPDSGYSGASSVDLGKSWYSQTSWDPTSQLNPNISHQQQLTVGNAQLLKQFSNASSGICVSPIETAKQELEELKSELGDVFSPTVATSTGSSVINSSLRNTIAHQNILHEDMSREEEIARRSASLPSFPDSFIPGIAGRNVNLNNSFNAQMHQTMPRQDIGQDSNASLSNSMNPEINYSNVLIVDEPLDVLDKEIEMIMAPQQKTPTTSEVLNFLEEYVEDPLNSHFEGLETLDEKSVMSSSSQVTQRNSNPFFLRPPPLSRDNSGGSSGEYDKLPTTLVPSNTIITVTASQDQSLPTSKMNYLTPPTSQPFKNENSLGANWPYANKNNKRSLFARKMQGRCSFNNDESSPQTKPPLLKAFHHSLDDGHGLPQQSINEHQITSFKIEAQSSFESTPVTSMNSLLTNTVSPLSEPSITATSPHGNTISGNSKNTFRNLNHHFYVVRNRCALITLSY